jgi:hypothetical protein
LSVLARRTRSALGAGLGLLLGTQTATGQTKEPPAANESRGSAVAQHTVVVVAAEQHPTLPLLRAELGALGIEVREVPPDAPVPPSDFRVVLGEGHIEVWVLDRPTGRVTMREVFTQPDGTPVESLTAVLRTVELLRWQLRAPLPERAPPSPPPKPPSRPPPDRSGWMLSGILQGVFSPGGTTLGAGTASSSSPGESASSSRCPDWANANLEIWLGWCR